MTGVLWFRSRAGLWHCWREGDSAPICNTAGAKKISPGRANPREHGGVPCKFCAGEVPARVWLRYVGPTLPDEEAPLPALGSTDARGTSLYFVQGVVTGLIKVGITRAFARRFAELQRASPDPLRILGVIPGTQKQEQQFLEATRHTRTHGEWCEPTPEIAAYIAEHFGMNVVIRRAFPGDAATLLRVGAQYLL